MIKSREKLYDYLRLNEAPYWTLYHVNNPREKIAESDQADNITMEESIDKLGKYLDITDGGRYKIVAKMHPDATTSGVYKESVEIAPGTGGSQAVAHIGATPAVNTAEIEDRIRKEYEQKYEMDKLRDEIKALKENPPSRVDKIIDQCAPYIGQIIAAKMGGAAVPAQAGVAGFPAESMSEADYTQALQIELEKLDDFLEPRGYDLLEAIRALVKFSEENPDSFTSTLAMLGLQKHESA